MQFGRIQRAFQAEDQPVVRVAWVVEAVLVGDERLEHGAQLDDAVPVAVEARQARHLGHQDQADFAQADGRDQALEAGALGAAGAGQAQVVVNDLDAGLRPAQGRAAASVNWYWRRVLS